MNCFYESWLFSMIFLVLLSIGIGHRAKFKSLGDKSALWGILIDARERYSLNRLQLVMWTILILSTFLGLLFSNLANPDVALQIPPELLGLIGISVGSATVAGAVKDNKNNTRREEIAGAPAAGFGASISSAVAPKIGDKPRFAQVFLEEEGEQGNRVVSVTKFQNFIITLASGLIYIVLTVKASNYPSFDQQVLWLIGISHAGYVGGKVPDKK